MKPNQTVIAGSLIFCGFLWIGGLLVLHGDATAGMSRFIYATVDLPAFPFLFVTAGLFIAAAIFLPVSRLRGVSVTPLVHALRPWHLALAVLVLTVAGTDLVYHGYAFSMDEYMTRFQGRIFESGALAGRIVEEWRPFGAALFHTFALYDPVSGVVASSYRPGMALLYAIFDLAALGPYVSAFLTPGSVVLVAAVARRIWPDSEEAPLIAALLLATSQQVLAGALTSYAMPAHLFFNLLWLWLFLGDSKAGHAAAPVVGVFTAALHQVHMHALFAAPFLLTLLRPFRWRLVAYYGAVYLAGHLLIVTWDHLALGGAAGAVQGGAAVESGMVSHSLLDRVLAILRIPDGAEFATVFALIARFFAWQNLALLPLLFFLVRRRNWSPTLVLVAASILLSVAPYPFLMPDQGHGWGYRYMHGLIGNFALLGAAGWIALNGRGTPTPRVLVMAMIVFSALVMIPVRALQIERTVGPYARASEYVRRLDSEVVVVDSYLIYYGTDLVRNGPFLENRPILLDLEDLPKDRLGYLCRRYAVTLVSYLDVEPFGVPGVSREQAVGLPAEYPRWHALLTSPGCRSR